jgi:hypothetical protein
MMTVIVIKNIIRFYNDWRICSHVMWVPIFALWGCIPELAKGCIDMTNSSSTYLGIVVGAAIGAVITWWVYNRQNKTSLKQDHVLERVNELEQKNTHILMHLETFAKHHDDLLNKIVLLNENMLELDKKMSAISEKHK